MLPLLIVNPRSGGGKTGELFHKIQQPLRRGLGDFDVAYTSHARHGVELAREAALDGRKIVVAVGGDGSIHEVVNGLMEARAKGANARLAIIGQGTGSDFRKTLRIEHRLEEYCSAIAHGNPHPIDIGRFSYTDHDGNRAEAYFVNILSIGLGGLVDQLVAKTPKTLGGTLAYFVASFRGLIQSEIGHLRCTFGLNGTMREEEIATRSLAICNGRFFGSGMQVAPMADLDDGIFDVIDLGSAPRFRFAFVSTGIYSGKHIHHPDVQHFRCDHIEIELLNKNVADKFLLDVDGEPLGRLPITVTLERQALEVLVP